MKERSPGPPDLWLAAPAAVSLAVWAIEEFSALTPALGAYGVWTSAAALALDSCILGLGLALTVLAILESRTFPGAGWLEIFSSLPVIILASAPLAYAYMEGRPEAIPVLLLAVRSLRILRLRRILPDFQAGVLAVLVAFELVRTLAGALLPDGNLYAASLRLLLLPEALLILAASTLGAKAPRPARSNAVQTGRTPSVVGEDELAGLLGKRSAW